MNTNGFYDLDPVLDFGDFTHYQLLNSESSHLSESQSHLLSQTITMSCSTVAASNSDFCFRNRDLPAKRLLATVNRCSTGISQPRRVEPEMRCNREAVEGN